MSALAYGIVIWAMDHSAMAGVVSLRESSVIFAAAIGALFMGESFGRWRIAAKHFTDHLLQFRRIRRVELAGHARRPHIGAGQRLWL